MSNHGGWLRLGDGACGAPCGQLRRPCGKLPYRASPPVDETPDYHADHLVEAVDGRETPVDNHPEPLVGKRHGGCGRRCTEATQHDVIMTGCTDSLDTRPTGSSAHPAPEAGMLVGIAIATSTT